MTKLDSILKSRDVALPTKIHPVKAMVFPYVMDGYAPVGYARYLTNLYGEWEKELPPEKQKSNHNIEVFKKNDEEA